MLNDRQRMILSKHLMHLMSCMLVAETEEELTSVGDDLQAVGLVLRGEQELDDVLDDEEIHLLNRDPIE